MPITFRQAEVFRAVAQDNSFSRASHRLLVSQSTVSEHIRALEEVLERKVFQRSRRRVELTSAGEHLLTYVERVFQLLEEAETAAKTSDDPFSGKVSFACASSTLLYQLPPILVEYSRSYPRVQLSILTDSIEGVTAELRAGVVDLALVAFPVSGRDFRKIALFDEAFVVILPTAHPLAGKSTIRIKELAGEPFILYRQGTNARRTIDRLFHKERFGPRIVMELNHTEAIKEMVANGFGVSLVPTSAFLTRTPTRDVAMLAIKGGGLKRSIGLIYLRSRAMSPSAKALLQLFQSHYSKGRSNRARGNALQG